MCSKIGPGTDEIKRVGEQAFEAPKGVRVRHAGSNKCLNSVGSRA
jgi:hypothetical protein